MTHHSTQAQSGNLHSRRFRFFTNTLFLLVVGLYCVWVLSLPVFPSQDGGVHLYYTNVLSHLLVGASKFNEFFYIRYPIPPYALHYYLLLLLTKLSSPAMAEKLVVLLIITSFALGFRFLARVTSRQGDLIALWALPLCLNWMLGMGFHNYCLSMSLALWTFGVWLLGNRSGALKYRLLFVSMAIVMLLTHPVPLFMLLIMTWGDLALRFVQHHLRRADSAGRPSVMLAPTRVDLVFAILASSTVGYIALFIDTNRSMENMQDTYFHWKTILDFVRLKPLSLISGSNAARLMRLGYYAVLIVSLLYGARGFKARFQQRMLQTADLFFMAAVGLIVSVPLLPRSINGADYFSDRLLIYIWIFALVAASAHVNWSRMPRLFSNVGACLFAVSSLFLVDHYVRPAANRVAQIEQVPIGSLRGPGFFIDAVETPNHEALTFDPFIWAACRYFRRADLVIFNAPWLDLPTMPVGPTQRLLTRQVRPQILNYPDKFRKLLAVSEPLRAEVSSVIRTIVFVGYPKGKGRLIDSVVERFVAPQSCVREDWFSVCSLDNTAKASAAPVPNGGK